MVIKILFVGEDWHGSNSTSCKRAFRYLGCDVLDVDDLKFFPQWESPYMRALRRFVRPLIVRDYGLYLKRLVVSFQPNFVFVFKGVMVTSNVLKFFHQQNALCFIFYPDYELYAYYRQFGNDIVRCFPLYDCWFTPKSFHIADLQAGGARRIEFMPYAYDPWTHFPITLSEEDKVEFRSDISFVGSWGEHKENILENLVNESFPYQFTIWGNRWQNLPNSSPLRKYAKFKPANGITQAKVFAGTKIALGLLSPPDVHTSRSFEIPAYRVFMLAERTLEHKMFFEEGKEAAFFEGPLELREKIDYYITHDQERQKITIAGYEKVTLHRNSYVDRMKRVLDLYQEIKRAEAS